jgi:hypothetical protein
MLITKEELKEIIGNDIDVKLHVFAMTEQLSVDPQELRNQLRTLVIKAVEAWGFVPGGVSIVGPNDDKEIYIKWSLGLSPDGVNSITGVKMDL